MACALPPVLAAALIVAAVPILALAAPSRASAARPDPLGGIVAEALRANLGLEGERLAERRSAEEVREAIGLWLPRVEVTSRLSEKDGVQNLGDLINPAYRTLNQLTDTETFPTNLDIPLMQQHETHLRVMQPLLAEGIRANLSAARARHDVQRFMGTAAARQIAAAVQIAYLQEASSRRVVEVHEAALDLVRENERVAERLLAAGRATPEAALRARADRADVEQQLAEARQQHLAVLGELNRILQRPLDRPAEAIPDAAFDLPLDEDTDSLIASALARREELASAQAGIRAAEAGERAATSRYLPTIAAGFDYGFQGPDFAFRNDEDFWVASIVATLEILDFTREARRGAAGCEVARSRVALRDAEDRIRLEVRTAHEAAVAAHAAIATSETRLDAARRTFDLVRRRYEEGVASSLELVDARTSLTSAELNRVLTAYRYAIRWVDLERAAALRDISL